MATSSGSPAIDNQARYVTEGGTVVAKPMKKEKGGKTSAVPVKAPDTSHVRHVDKSFAVPPGPADFKVWSQTVVVMDKFADMDSSSLQLVRKMQRLTLHLMDCGHLRNTCRSKPTEPSGRFWLVCQGLRLETQDKGLSKENQVNPCWIMGISDRCSYSLWVVAKHCFVIFLIECWAALGFSHEGRISA